MTDTDRITNLETVVGTLISWLPNSTLDSDATRTLLNTLQTGGKDSKAWRLGTKMPLNVYSGDRPVCQCHTMEDAAMIVAAMNLYLGKSKIDIGGI